MTFTGCSLPKPQTPLATAGDAGDVGSTPGSGRFPWRRKWHPTSVFLPGESHGQRSLKGCSPWGHKEPDTTEQLSTHACTLPKQRNRVRLLSWCSLAADAIIHIPLLLLLSCPSFHAPLYAGSPQQRFLCPIRLLLTSVSAPLPWRVSMWPRWASHNTKSLCPHWLVQRWVTCPKSGQSELFASIC